MGHFPSCCGPAPLQCPYLSVWAAPSKFPDVFSRVNIYPSTILCPEDAMPMQIMYLLLWADSHPNSLCSWRWKSMLLASVFDVCCSELHAVVGRYPSNFCVVVGRSAFAFHVCRFDSISMFFVVGQHPPNDYHTIYVDMGYSRPKT